MVDIQVTDEHDEISAAELRRRVIDFNVSATGYDDGRSLSCFVRNDDGVLVAGLDGYTWGGYAKIEWLWVAEQLRGQGVGRRLVEAAERAALERECGIMRVDTHSFKPLASTPNWATRR